jgi:AraC family transcriptional regulator of arabinose operon
MDGASAQSMQKKEHRKPSVRVVDGTAVPRPRWDAACAPGLLSDHYQVGQGYHIIRRRGTPTSYMVYTLGGRGFFRDERDRYLSVKKGDLVLINARSYQEYGIEHGAAFWNVHWIHFDVQPQFSRWLPLAGSPGLKDLSTVHVSAELMHSQISDLFFELQTELRAQSQASDQVRDALALNLLERVLILAQSASAGSEGRPKDPRMWRVLEAIEQRPHAPAAVSELAALVGLSPSRLAHLFKQQTGVSLLAAANRVRLRAARDVLDQSGTTLMDAAEAAGFSSPFSFSHWFHRQAGLRPSAYRKARAGSRPGRR